MRPDDTTPEIHRRQIERYRAMSGEERVVAALELSETLMAFTADGIRRRHPDYDDEQLRFALARLRLGDSFFQEAFPGVDLLDP